MDREHGYASETCVRKIQSTETNYCSIIVAFTDMDYPIVLGLDRIQCHQRVPFYFANEPFNVALSFLVCNQC